MKNQCVKSEGFHLEPLFFSNLTVIFVYAKHQWSIFMRFIASLCRARKFSHLLSFLPSSVMILSTFHSCFSSFELKQIVVVFNCPVWISFLIIEYTFLACTFCFPNSDHVMFSRESAFCLFINYAYIGTWMHVHKTKNKTDKLKRLLWRYTSKRFFQSTACN